MSLTLLPALPRHALHIGEVRGFPLSLVELVFCQLGPGTGAQPHPGGTRHERKPTGQRTGRMAAAPAQHK